MTDLAAPPAGTTRAYEGMQLPIAGGWSVDPTHSSVEFVARHLMVAKVRGRFREYDVQLVIADDPTESTLRAEIVASSITTGDDGRDASLRGPDFLDAEHYPVLRFESREVVVLAANRFAVVGDFTIREQTHPLSLAVELTGTTIDPWKNERAFYSASAEFDRYGWGLDWNQAFPGGGLAVGRNVRIELEVSAIRTGG